MRIAFAQYPEFARIYLVTMFLKKDAENLSAADRRAIKSVLDDLSAALRSGGNP